MRSLVIRKAWQLACSLPMHKTAKACHAAQCSINRETDNLVRPGFVQFIIATIPTVLGINESARLIRALRKEQIPCK
jgi:hypothetical protein